MKCKTCQSDQPNYNIKTPSDDNNSEPDANTEHDESSDDQLIKDLDSTPAHLYAHEDGTRHGHLVPLVIERSNTIVKTLSDPAQANQRTYVTSGDGKRLHPHDIQSVYDPHELQLQQ